MLCRRAVNDFELNGAQIKAVHLQADLSENGLRQSSGAMVNYGYELNKISDNLKRFGDKGQVAVSGSVRGLARQGAGALASLGKNDPDTVAGS